MPRHAVRQLQKLLTEPQQQQQQQRRRRRRRQEPLRLPLSSSSITAITTTEDGVLLCCYRLLRNPSTMLIVMLLFGTAMFALGGHLAHDDYEVVLTNNEQVAPDIASTNPIKAMEKSSPSIIQPNDHDSSTQQSALDYVKTLSSNHQLSIQQSTLDHLKTLADFPKIVHLIWSDRNILTKKYEILEHGVKHLRRLNPDWQFIVHDYAAIDATFKNFRHKDISLSSLAALKRAHIVEKTDAFRLLKIYTMGGLYVDIDRVMNVNLNEIINVQRVKLVLATYYDINFTNDLFGSSPGNKLILDAFKRQCVQRTGYPRKNGWIRSSDQMNLVETYTNSIETDLFGRQIGSDNGSLWDEARHVLTSHSGGMVITYKDVWCDGLLVNDFEGCKQISRASLYNAYGVEAWKKVVDEMWNGDDTKT